MNSDDAFDWDAYEKAVKEQPLYPVEKCYCYIEEVIESDIIRLYDSIDLFLFQDIDYDRVASNMPMWVADAGLGPEINCTKDWYEKLRRSVTHPIFGRFIYHSDLCGKVAAMQDRLNAVIMFMKQFYNIVPCRAKYSEDEYTSASRSGGPRETEAHMLLNCIFVAFASVLDILSKISVEQFEFSKYDFNHYRKMISADVIYKKNLNNIDPSLKTTGMLFSEPPVIRKIETFRNEFVHNGPWDLRCSIYSTSVDGVPADTIIYSPDMDEFGNFISSGSRNKFYSQANRINIQLPNIIEEACSILKRTINQLSILYQKNTTKSVNKKYTQECLDAILKYYKS